MYGDVDSNKERDKQRRVACFYQNITYMEVPYWWQHDKESILAIMHQVRPDIVPHAMVTPFQYPKNNRTKLGNKCKNFIGKAQHK